MGQPITLHTDRLILREFAPDDWLAVHEYASDPVVVTHMPWGPNDEAMTRDFITRVIAKASQEPRREFELAVVLREGARLIGGCGLSIDNPEHKEGCLGYCYNRRFWGRGYATEAARAIMTFGFEQLGLHRVFATCDVRNVASWRVMGKLRMRREGCLLQNKWQRGRWRDTFAYGVLAAEWREKQTEQIADGLRIAPFTISDYDDVVAFWRKQEGIGLNESDERDAVASYLNRNPAMSFIVRDGREVVAAVLCGHDGRRGYLHHLAVAPSHRKQGIGRRLVERCLERLREAGIDKCYIFLFDGNDDGEGFWTAMGFRDRGDLKVMQKPLLPAVRA